MNYSHKYIKYKTKYVKLKHRLMHGGENLQFYNIAPTEFKFESKPYADIVESTSAAFLDLDMIVVTKPGKIYLIENYQSVDSRINLIVDDFKTINSDFTSKDTEEGLLGICYLSNPDLKIYLSYTTRTNDKMNLLIDEFTFGNRKLVRIKNIFSLSFDDNIHHGGHLVAGPDDLIYVGIGDGGPQNDPENHSQNLNLLQGKMIQINPRNQFYKIIASGLRNPWSFSIDSKNQIWIGDVGWDTVESIKVITDLKKITNFGWSYFEGSRLNKNPPPMFLLDPDTPINKINIQDTIFEPPVWEYPNTEKTGKCVIGGFYVDELNAYVFADYMGFIRAIKFDQGKWTQVGFNKLPGQMIYSLAYDGNQIYLLTEKSIQVLTIEILN